MFWQISLSLIVAASMAAFGCQEKKETEKKDKSDASSTNTAVLSDTSTDTGDATGNTKTKTSSKTDTETETSTDQAKKLLGEFKLDVDGKFFTKTFTKKGFKYTFKKSGEDFPMIPDSVKTVSGIKNISYKIGSDHESMDIILDRGSSNAKITIVLSIEWSDDDNFTATKESCKSSKEDVTSKLVCSQLSKLEITGERVASKATDEDL